MLSTSTVSISLLSGFEYPSFLDTYFPIVSSNLSPTHRCLASCSASNLTHAFYNRKLKLLCTHSPLWPLQSWEVLIPDRKPKRRKEKTRSQSIWQNLEHDSFSDADFHPRRHYLEHKVMFEWDSDSWWLWPSWQGVGGNSRSGQGGRLHESRGISPPHVLPLLPKFLHTWTPNPVSERLNVSFVLA